jgi:hypothetical protein
MRQRLRLATRAVIVCVSFVGPARAQGAETASLPLTSYQVPDGCPVRAAFEAQVLSRLTGRSASAGQLRLGVEVVQDGSAAAAPFSGRLHVGDEGTMANTREVHGASCAEVVEALALLAALSLETRAEPEAARVESAAVQAPEVPPAARWTKGPLALALAQSAAAPEGALGAGVGVALQAPAYGVLTPWLMLALYRTLKSSASLPDNSASATFTLTAVYVVGCPVRWPATGWWSLRPCMDFDLGRLSGRGLDSTQTEIETQRGLWASIGLGGRAEINVWGPVWLAALVGAVVPLARHEFYFAPDAVIFHVPATGWRGAGFVSLMF